METLILSDDSPHSSREAVVLLLNSIYRDPSYSALKQDLEKSLLQVVDRIGNHDSLINEIYQQLVARAQSGTLAVAAAQQALQELNAHIKMTAENSRVYCANNELANPNAMFWPDPTEENSTRSLFNELPYSKTFKFVDKQTPLGSMGSCFATEIAFRFQKANFNYVVTERICTGRAAKEGSTFSDACAGWGTIFNVPAMRQLVEKAFGLRKMPKLLWEGVDDGLPSFRDPFRESIIYRSIEEYEMGIERHIAAAREAFMRCKVFVITLGLNEVWYLKSDGSVLSRCPWRLAPSLTERRVVNAEENLAELEKMLGIWRSFNPDIKIIVTVSPVPLHATFRSTQHHVVAANCHSKSTLRVVAEEFVKRNKDVFYFPSYETVMYCTQNPFEPDGRHVTRSTVDNVMKLFSKMFIVEKDAESLLNYETQTPITQASPIVTPAWMHELIS